MSNNNSIKKKERVTINVITESDTAVTPRTIINSKSPLDKYSEILFKIIIGQIKKDDEEFKEYRIPMKVVKKAMQYKGNDIYDKLRDSLRKLGDCWIEIKTKDEENGKYEWKRYPLFGVVGYKQSDYVLLGINDKLKKFFLDLKGNYTPIGVVNFIKLKNRYQMRIYDIVMDNDYLKSNKPIEYDIDEFKDIIGVDRERYKNFAELNRRILLPTQKHLKSVGIKYDMDTYTQGRKVKSIVFENIQKGQVKEIKIDEKVNEDEHIKILKKYFTGIRLKRLIKTFKDDKDHVIEKYKATKEIEKTNRSLQRKSNFAKYLYTCLNNGYDPSISKRKRMEIDRTKKRLKSIRDSHEKNINKNRNTVVPETIKNIIDGYTVDNKL